VKKNEKFRLDPPDFRQSLNIKDYDDCDATIATPRQSYHSTRFSKFRNFRVPEPETVSVAKLEKCPELYYVRAWAEHRNVHCECDTHDIPSDRGLISLYCCLHRSNSRARQRDDHATHPQRPLGFLHWRGVYYMQTLILLAWWYYMRSRGPRAIIIIPNQYKYYIIIIIITRNRGQYGPFSHIHTKLQIDGG